jgi:outer membrane protein assembly factor BamA
MTSRVIVPDTGVMAVQVSDSPERHAVAELKFVTIEPEFTVNFERVVVDVVLRAETRSSVYVRESFNPENTTVADALLPLLDQVVVAALELIHAGAVPSAA